MTSFHIYCSIILGDGTAPSLEWFQKRRTEMIKFYAGDLYAFIDGISQAEWMRKNIATSSNLPLPFPSSGTAGNQLVKKKAGVALHDNAAAFGTSRLASVGTSSQENVDWHSGGTTIAKKEKVWIGPFPRSTKLKPLRTGLTKHIEKTLIEEYAVPARPIIPVESQIEAYDDIRGFMLMLLDERKLLDRLEAQLKVK